MPGAHVRIRLVQVGIGSRAGCSTYAWKRLCLGLAIPYGNYASTANALLRGHSTSHGPGLGNPTGRLPARTERLVQSVLVIRAIIGLLEWTPRQAACPRLAGAQGDGLPVDKFGSCDGGRRVASSGSTSETARRLLVGPPGVQPASHQHAPRQLGKPGAGA